MSVDALIVHHMACNGESPPEVRLGAKVLAADGQASSLVDALKNGFLSRLSREHGCFAAEGEPAPLPRELQAFADRQLDFLELSSRLMAQWKGLLDQQPQEIDADVIFILEAQAGRQVFYLLVAGYKTAFHINKEQVIESTRYLDLGSSLFGIKVDMQEWLNAGHYVYLTLVSPQGGRKLADAFLALVGFTRGLDKRHSTDTFLAGVEAYSRQMDEQEQVESFRSQVVDYCADQELRDAPVDLHELSRSVDGLDGERFSSFMADYMPEDDSALMLDRRSLRRFVKFAGRERDLAISFSSSQLNSRVHYDPDKDRLSIDGVPRALREQLLRHLSS